MSNYDPFHIYDRQIRKSHKGQVIRKKLVSPVGRIYSNKELDDVIPVLGRHGYHVIPKSISIFYNQYDSRDFTWTKELGQLQINDLNPVHIQFSQVWNDNNIKNFYKPVFDIDPLTVIALNFEIYIQAVQIYGTIQLNNPQINGDNPGFNIPGTNVLFDPATTGGNVILASISTESNFSVFSYSSTNVMCQSSFERTDGRTVRDITLPSKQNIDSSAAIFHYSYHQPAILTALKNSDYTVLNPDLIDIGWLGDVGSLPFTSNHHLISVTINLEVVHK